MYSCISTCLLTFFYRKLLSSHCLALTITYPMKPKALKTGLMWLFYALFDDYENGSTSCWQVAGSSVKRAINDDDFLKLLLDQTSWLVDKIIIQAPFAS